MNKFGAQNMVSHLKKVLMKKPQKFMSKVDLLKWNYTSPLDQDILNENYNEFYKIIKNSGTEIVDLKLRNENEELCDSIFTHDPSLVLKDGAIILNMGKELRKKEIFAGIHYSKAVHQQKLLDSNKNYLPITDKISKEVLSLPIYPGLRKKSLKKVIDVINNF